ncbi:MAG: hypothetical protein KDG55_04890 [Rhodocyclaceae bacterium]|nr:hypothetical protein [Rhodocyclaceae bacterium]
MPSTLRPPRLRWPAALAACLLATAAQAGEIRVEVRADDGEPLADAVIVAVPEQGGAAAGARRDRAVMDQEDKEFVPYVLPITVGTQVDFPNHDSIRHHVYSFSPAKRFELPLYIGQPAAPVRFDTPGVVVLGCNIHDWMIAYVYVADSPFFTRSGEDGMATLGPLPAGRYQVRVWHPRLDGAEADTARALDVPATGALSARWQLGLKPDFRIPRAPIPGGSGY